ncbi:hypothetical protein KUTeg_022115, partial [Tegillarca granosa]
MYALVVVSLFGAVGSALGSVTGNAPKGTYVCHQPSSDNTTIYDFTLKDIYKNRDINFSQFQGKVTLIVNQEPGANATEILNGIKHVRPGGGFVPNFPLTEKVDKHCGYVDEQLFPYLMYDPKNVHDVRWNFEKFLIGANGKPLKRYHTVVEPIELEDDIKFALGVVPVGTPNPFKANP